MSRRSLKSGLTLGTTLLVVLMAFTLAASSVHHLQANARLTNGAHARQLADSAIALALEKVLADESFGKDGLGTVEIVDPDWAPAGSRAVLTFDNESAGRQGIPYSTNNLGTDNDSVPGWSSRTVPASGVHLVAVAECRGAQRRVEAVLRVPPFPYVIATSGTIRSDGGLLVAAIDSSESLSPGISRIDHEDLLPGDVLSDAEGSGSILLGPGTRITGDLHVRNPNGLEVRPPGTPIVHAVEPLDYPLGPDVEILGEVLTDASGGEVPRLDVASYDPVGRSGVQILAEDAYQSQGFKGYVRWQGDTLRLTGGVELDGALLYADGDLEVEGGISGVGAVVTTGRLTVEGGTVLQADNALGLLSQGDLSIRGGGKDGTYIQGLVYTEGQLSLEEITLVGTIIQKRADRPALLNSLNVIQSPEYTRLDFQVRPVTDPDGPLSVVYLEGMYPLGWPGSKSELNPPTSTPNQHAEVRFGGAWIYNPRTVPMVKRRLGGGAYSRRLIVAANEEGGYTLAYQGTRLSFRNLSYQTLLNNIPAEVVSDGWRTLGSVPLESLDEASLEEATVALMTHQGLLGNWSPPNPDAAGVAYVRVPLQQGRSHGVPIPIQEPPTGSVTYVAEDAKRVGRMLAGGTVSINPSLFLRPEDRLRLGLWREL